MGPPDPGLDNQADVRSTLRLVGWLALVLGIVLTGMAMIDFFSAFGSFEQPRNFWMGFVGVPLIAIGSWMLKAGYLGVASRYLAGEVTPTVRDALGQIRSADPGRACADCGAANDADAAFCDSCGSELTSPAGPMR